MVYLFKENSYVTLNEKLPEIAKNVAYRSHIKFRNNIFILFRKYVNNVMKNQSAVWLIETMIYPGVYVLY